VVQLREGLEIVEVEDGRVVLDTKQGTYWHLNTTAMTLLEELGRGRRFDDVVQEIARTTGVDEARVRADHLGLIKELRRAKLIDGNLT
jgi:DNA-directed RNA polymerase delta subunit